MCAPDAERNVRQAAVRLLALEDINRTARRQLTDRQEQEFKKQYDAASAGLPAALWGAYLVTVVPSNGKPWVGWEYGMQPYRSGDTLSARVWTRLKDENRVLEQFDPDFLLKRDDPRFQYLWPEDREYINVADLWDGFARYTYLPLLESPQVLQHTVAWGVNRGLFAYCLGDPEGYNFDTVYFEQRVTEHDCVISEHAWLLDADIARKLREPESAPDADRIDSDRPAVVMPHGEETNDREPEPPQRRGYAAVRIETHLNHLNWRQFYNSVIQPLVEAGAKLELQLMLEAVDEDGLDPDLIDLRVRESVVQLDRNASVQVWDRD